MRRLPLCLLLLLVNGCQQAPLPVATERANAGLGEQLGQTLELRISNPLLPVGLNTQAVLGEVNHLTLTLHTQSDTDTVLATYQKSAPFTSPYTAIFKNVRPGTYRVKVQAFSSSDDSVSITQGGATLSSNSVTVALGSSPVYSLGSELSIALQLLIPPVATINGAFTTPSGLQTGYQSFLFNSSGTKLEASYASASSVFKYLNIPDGTYYAWGFGHDGAGKATPAKKSGNVVVSGNATSVSGNLNMSITALLSALAGAGIGDTGLATNAMLGNATAVAVNSSGNVYIADTSNHRIRMIPATDGTYFGQSMTANYIYTIAGTGTSGSSDNVDATQATLNTPTDIAVDSSGNLYIADRNNDRIRMIVHTAGTYFGNATSRSSGEIFTLISSGLNDPTGLALDTTGNLFVVDNGTGGGGGGNDSIQMLVKTAATHFGASRSVGDLFTVQDNSTVNNPYGIAVDGNGNLIFSEHGNGSNDRIRMRVVTNGTYFGTSRTASSMLVDVVTSANLNLAHDVALDTTGNLYFADASDDKINMVVNTNGTYFGTTRTAGSTVRLVAGTGTAGFSGDAATATSATIDNSMGVAVSSGGHLYIADTDNKRIRVVANSNATILGKSISTGNIDTVAGNASTTFAGEKSLATQSALSGALDIITDSSNNIYVADTSNHRVRMIPAADGSFFGQNMLANRIYTIAGNGTSGTAGDDGAATSANLSSPNGLAIDNSSNLYIADTGNNRVRKVNSSGTISAVSTGAFTLSAPGDVEVDGSSNLYIADTTNNRILKITSGTTTSHVTSLSAPKGVVADASGNLYIVNSSNHRVAMYVNAAGTYFGIARTAGDVGSTFTIAGSSNGSTGDGGIATSAKLTSPQRLVRDLGGNLYIADTGNHKIRMVAASGNIYTVAGTGTSGSTGTGGLATSALLQSPAGVALTSTGKLLMTTSNSFIRSVL